MAQPHSKHQQTATNHRHGQSKTNDTPLAGVRVARDGKKASVQRIHTDAKNNAAHGGHHRSVLVTQTMSTVNTSTQNRTDRHTIIPTTNGFRFTGALNLRQ